MKLMLVYETNLSHIKCSFVDSLWIFLCAVRYNVFLGKALKVFYVIQLIHTNIYIKYLHVPSYAISNIYTTYIVCGSFIPILLYDSHLYLFFTHIIMIIWHCIVPHMKKWPWAVLYLIWGVMVPIFIWIPSWYVIPPLIQICLKQPTPIARNDSKHLSHPKIIKEYMYVILA